MIVNNASPIDRDYALRVFPKIDIEGFRVTSELNPFYNCFAWAGDDNTINWEPSKSKFVKWFTEDTAFSLENFINNYSRIGYTEIAESAEFEPNFDKIAIYVNNDGEPSHAARQLENGKWTSKLGMREDIEHSTPECVENEVYGKVKVILKRLKREVQMEKPKTVSKQSTNFENFKNIVKGIVNVPKKEIDEQLNLEREKKVKTGKRK